MMVEAEHGGYLCRLMEDEDATQESPGTFLDWLTECKNDLGKAREYVAWQRSFNAKSVTEAVRMVADAKVAHVYYFTRNRWYVYPVTDGRVGSGLWSGVVLASRAEEIQRLHASRVERWLSGGLGGLAGVGL